MLQKELIPTSFASVKVCVKWVQRVQAGLFRGAALLFLALYAIGSLPVESFHQLFHAHHSEATLHTEVQEANDCHRLIYHNQSTGDCQHDAHITESTHCPWCQTVVQQVQVAPESWQEITLISLFNPPFSASDFSTQQPQLHLPPRAPPVLS